MVVPDRQMEDFMRVVALTGANELERVPLVEGDKVVVVEGDFAGIEGIVTKINGRKRFVTTLSKLTAYALHLPISSLKRIQ